MRWLPRALNAPIAFQSAILGALVVLPVVVTAHHSRVEYTYGAMHEIEGEVIRVLWRNPHIMFTVRAIDAGGSVKDWVLEGPGAGPEGIGYAPPADDPIAETIGSDWLIFSGLADLNSCSPAEAHSGPIPISAETKKLIRRLFRMSPDQTGSFGFGFGPAEPPTKLTNCRLLPPTR
jgi:hypothetical protein